MLPEPCRSGKPRYWATNRSPSTRSNRRANQVAAVLTSRGLGRGDPLVRWSATALELVPLFAAAAKLGVAFAPTNASLGMDEAAGRHRAGPTVHGGERRAARRWGQANRAAGWSPRAAARGRLKEGALPLDMLSTTMGIRARTLA